MNGEISNMPGECKRAIKKRDAKAIVKLSEEDGDEEIVISSEDEDDEEQNTTVEEFVRKTKRGRDCLSSSDSNSDSDLPDID